MTAAARFAPGSPSPFRAVSETSTAAIMLESTVVPANNRDTASLSGSVYTSLTSAEASA